jgi:ectoine hydroxylase-related dioxygenase (phytanoyl-CoA dioxygenase family)
MPDASTHLSQLNDLGYCIVDGVIPNSAISRIRQHVIDGIAVAQQEYESSGGMLGRQRTAEDEPGTNAVAYVPELAPYLGNENVLSIARGALDPKIRIAQIEFKTRPPNDDKSDFRSRHTDWPHDLYDRDRAGRIRQPFPDITMCLSTLWMLSPFSAENGGTWIVPKSHKNVRNPRGENDGMNEFSKLTGEIQIEAPAGSVLIMDTRIWHSNANNPSRDPRVCVVARYAPWWLSTEYGGRNQSIVPAETFNALPPGVQTLFRHRAENADSRDVSTL